MLALLLIGIPGNLRHLGNPEGPEGLEAASWQIATRDGLLARPICEARTRCLVRISQILTFFFGM